VLIPGELVLCIEENKIILTNQGRELVGIIIADKTFRPKTRIGELRREIARLEFQKADSSLGTFTRQEKLLEIHALQEEIIRIVAETINFKKARIDSYGQMHSVITA
jgi:uncharacterized small protein (DUF1192 family)